MLLDITSKQTDKIQRAKEQIQGTHEDIAVFKREKAKSKAPKSTLEDPSRIIGIHRRAESLASSLLQNNLRMLTIGSQQFVTSDLRSPVGALLEYEVGKNESLFTKNLTLNSTQVKFCGTLSHIL